MDSITRMDRWRGRLTLTVALVLAAALMNCSSKTATSPSAGSTPYLGLVPNPSDFTYADSLGSAILTARALGADFMQMGELWSTLEPAPGAVDVSAVRQAMAQLQALGFGLYFNLRIVDTNNRGVPADLASVAFDDPALVARVDAVVDSLIGVFEQYPLVAFSFGNEVDAYFGANPTELAAYRALFQRTIARVRARLPSLRIGCCTQSPPSNPTAWVGDTLNAYTDIVIYTYYPFQPSSDFVHRSTSTFEPDMAAMIARAGGKPLGLQEVGYSSSPDNGSSQAQQADMVRRFRLHMASARREQVLFASWFLMTDWSSQTLGTLFGYYGFYSPGFGAFLGNLGLRDTMGTPKQAWSTWRVP